MCLWWQVVENNPCREFPRHPIGWKQSPGSWETSADFAALPMLLLTLTSLTRCRNIPGPEIIAGTRPSSEHPGFGDTHSQLPVRGADNSRLPIYPARYHPPLSSVLPLTLPLLFPSLGQWHEQSKLQETRLVERPRSNSLGTQHEHFAHMLHAPEIHLAPHGLLLMLRWLKSQPQIWVCHWLPTMILTR